MNTNEKIQAIRTAAENGDADSQCKLGEIYNKGDGLPQNDGEAIKWLNKAAAQKHPRAEFCLGWFHVNGRGVSKDINTAIKWYQRATMHGDTFAPYYLAEIYESGNGVDKNLEVALKWYKVASEKGNKKAIEKVAQLEASRPPVNNARTEIVAEHPTNNLGSKSPMHRVSREQKANNADDIYAEHEKETGECKILLEACTPLVYVHNAFRITGLPVDASTRDIKRRIDDLKAAEEMGDGEDEHDHAFASVPPPSLDHIREAAQRLQDPERRLIEEFFWFWPEQWGDGKNDSALTALRKGDKDTAFKEWSRTIRDADSNAAVVAKHNLAVMYQLVALDSEHVFLNTDSSPGHEQLTQVEGYWRTCFTWWEELTDDEQFWSLVTDRIRLLDDPRLTTGFARRMRSTFPIAFDRINAHLAMRYAEDGKFDMAKRHVGYMEETHQGKDDVESTVALIMKPLETRVAAAVERTANSTRKDPKSAAKYAKELLEITQEPLSIAKVLLKEQHSVRAYIFEQVTDTCFSCLIAYGNATEDWPTCIDLLKQTEVLAVTLEVREKIKANIAVAEKNQTQKLLFETCWFCKKQKAIEAAKLETKMYGDVTRTPSFNGTQIQWRNVTVTVPRCGSCKEAHKDKVGGAFSGAAAGAAAGTAIFPGVGSIVGLIAGWAIGCQVDTKLRLPAGVTPVSSRKDFPPIKELLGKGWAIGDRPSV